MTLTAKQEAFCQAIADGKNQSDSYRIAYNALNQKAETLASNASRLMADVNVLARVNELREALTAKALWSREQSINVLSAITNDGANSEKIAAVKELNSMHGFNAPTKSEMTLNLPKRIVIEHAVIEHARS